jgi:hypothetical protein
MPMPMNIRNQRLCAWSGPALIVVFMIGFCLVAGLIPPPSPGLPAADVARFYAEHQTRIRIGLVISMLGAGLALPFPVTIMLQMRRIEGSSSPMAWVQLVSGLFNTPLFVLPMFGMAAATYRPLRAPEITQALSDLGWLTLVGFGAPAIVQTIAIAIAVLGDRRENPVFARWVGYFNAWCALLFLPGLLVICFHGGPFAYNGVFAFWIPLTVFGAWFFVMCAVLMKAIRQEEQESVGATTQAPLTAGSTQ